MIAIREHLESRGCCRHCWPRLRT